MNFSITIVLTVAKSKTVKLKRTFSLSSESLTFLEEVRRQKKAPSTSSVLDELIREQKRLSRRQAMGREITAYYDSINEEELNENAAWGQLGETQFPEE